jgi:phospholipid-binding lipoprotein MlaA
MTLAKLSIYSGLLNSGPKIAGVLAVWLLAACAQQPAPQGFADPNEANNREVHAFNLAVDRAIVRPLSRTMGEGPPGPVRKGVTNFAENLDVPGDVVNNLLQGRPANAVENTFRFVINTTVGLGGLFDPASALGIEGKQTDFGETMHVWGAPEGEYAVVPFVGPSTSRDLAGTLVDIAMNPTRLVLTSPASEVATVAGFASRLGDRARYSDTVDSVLYDSADGYAQARLLYLQNRRYELGQTSGAAADDGFLDPYEDPYGN